MEANELRRHLAHDPMSHERGADPNRVFRVDVLARDCRVSADVIREWALGLGAPNVWQALVIEIRLEQAQRP